MKVHLDIINDQVSIRVKTVRRSMKREGGSLTSNNMVSIKKLSFIIKGSTRIKIFLSLLDGIKTAREIEIETSVLLPSICRSLKGMIAQGIIECLNINDTQGKLYKLSAEAITLAPIVIDKAKKKLI